MIMRALYAVVVFGTLLVTAALSFILRFDCGFIIDFMGFLAYDSSFYFGYSWGFYLGSSHELLKFVIVFIMSSSLR